MASKPAGIPGRVAGTEALCYRLGVLTGLLFLACRGPDPVAGALDAEPGAPFAVWASQSADGRLWTRRAEPVAHRMSSLGLHVDDRGDLALTGLFHTTPPTWWEELVGDLQVFGLRYDGEAYVSAAWPVEDRYAVAAVDPQGFEGGFWYYAAEGRAGDPAVRAGEHHIRSSPPAVTRLVAEGLADPSPVRFGGELLLFATQVPDAVVLAAGEPLAIRQRFPGVTVPFALEVDGALWLLAQGVVGGRRQPVVATSADGRTWSDWAPMIDMGRLQSCTSPVMGPDPAGAGWLMFGVEEPGR